MKTLAWIIMALFVCTQWSILTIEALPSSTPLIIDSAHVGLRNKTTGVVIPWECHVCEEGSGLSVECGRTFDIGTYIGCVKCRKGVTFSDKRDIGQCKQCNSCSRNEIRIGRCEVDKNTVKCICKAEFYRDEGSRDCKPCSWCCHGKINQVVEKCKKFPKLPMGRHCSFQDVKQCAPTTKPTNSAETLHHWSEFPAPSTSKEIIITDNKEEQDVQEGKGKGNSTHTTFIILIVGLPCCVIIIIGAIVPIAYTRRKRRLCQQKPVLLTEDGKPSIKQLHIVTIKCNTNGIHMDINNGTAVYDKEADVESRVPLLATPGNNIGAAGLSTPEPAEDQVPQATFTLEITGNHGMTNTGEVLDCSQSVSNLPLAYNRKKLELKVSNIPNQTYIEICAMLDAEDPFFHDYRMFAEELGYSKDSIQNMKASPNPTDFLLSEHNLTVKKLIEILKNIRREDVLEKIEQWLTSASWDLSLPYILNCQQYREP